MDISIICCYTKTILVEKMKESIKDFGSINIQWILVDNTLGRFKSAAEALNYGYQLSDHEVLFFVHQDIEFDCEETVVKLYNLALNGHIVGVAGRKEKGGPIIANVLEGVGKESNYNYNFQSGFEYVLTCDECVLAMNKNVFEMVGGFDSKNFDGWHFYGVDLCLAAREYSITSVVVPCRLWHKSKGNHDKNWERYEKVLRKKYKKQYKVIYYPCGRCYTNVLLFNLAKLLRPIQKKRLERKKRY